MLSPTLGSNGLIPLHAERDFRWTRSPWYRTGRPFNLPKLAIQPEKTVARLEEAIAVIRSSVPAKRSRPEMRSSSMKEQALRCQLQAEGHPGLCRCPGPRLLDLAKSGRRCLITHPTKDFQVAIPIIKAADEKVGKRASMSVLHGNVNRRDVRRHAMRQRSLQHLCSRISAGIPHPSRLDLNNVAKIKAASQVRLQDVGNLSVKGD
jgi:5,10-methylenetetrahydromethanopterin reductase